MISSTSFLLLTAASVALIHTLAGPDHYLPFAAMARAFSWSRQRTIAVTLVCGLGHVLSSVLLGLAGIALGLGLASLQAIESARGRFAALALAAFGLLYCAWGFRRAMRNQPHGHTHGHADGTVHAHTHVHEHDHLHVHPRQTDSATTVTPWLLFTVFLLGPCEPLIPLVMYPAANRNWMDVGLVTLVFGLVTLLTMTVATLSCAAGMRQIRIASLERYSHALAGSIIALCGFAILVLHI
jgi:sulfite exporter TauE/SafE